MLRSPLIVALMAALLTVSGSAAAQSQAKPGKTDSDQQIPDAPQPQKRPKQPAPPDMPSDPAPSEDPPAPAQKPPAANDNNAFPEDVSRAAAKAAQPSSDSNAPEGAKPPTANENPFPEDVSRDAAKAAEQKEPAQAPAPNDLPPGVSSSQSDSSSSVQEVPAQPDSGRAAKDVEVGSYYLKSRDYQGALLRYKDATAADPTNVEAIFGLAETQRSLGKSAEAVTNYQLYLDIVPDGPKAKDAMKALKVLRASK
jgi:tetratricopeptide (TPR) repeat protein